MGESREEFERILTDREAAEILRLNPRGVRAQARLGNLRGRKCGRYWRFKLSWINEYMERENEKDATISNRATVAAPRKAH